MSGVAKRRRVPSIGDEVESLNGNTALYWVENDYIIWTPLALYAAHAAIMLLLVVRSAIQRFAGQGTRASSKA